MIAFLILPTIWTFDFTATVSKKLLLHDRGRFVRGILNTPRNAFLEHLGNIIFLKKFPAANHGGCWEDNHYSKLHGKITISENGIPQRTLDMALISHTKL